jgi:D-alanyl-lipoteichoic acid acyltransferase DltB (MBOAT superfamily)
MLFNSLDFALFFPLVFILYWTLAKNLKAQNLFIVIVSFVFYAFWDWRFLGLLVFSSIVDFLISFKLDKEQNNVKRKVLLWSSILINLGFLGFFKYFNFFIDNFIEAFSLFGVHFRKTSLQIVLPVGISFYTFQTLSYTIDVYKRKLQPTRDIVSFFAFVSFFPQLVAGPIERASNLLPQFFVKRKFDYIGAVDGMRQILWGLFKKIVIADNCAHYVEVIFGNSDTYSGLILVLGAIFFAFQIYGDFSGYSDIAIGLSRLLGFNLMRNFNFPYFSRDIAEFWRRWHISLSTWFRDYLYFPLGGSEVGTFKKIKNTFIIFIVSGFWHGANWTFIFWGLLNAFFFLPLLLSNSNRKHLNVVASGKLLPSLKEIFQMATTFMLTIFAWIFFRSENIGHAGQYITRIFKSPGSFFTLGIYQNYSNIIILILIFVIIEWIGREGQYAISQIDRVLNKFWRWSFYLIVIFSIYLFGYFSDKVEFIYFQF